MIRFRQKIRIREIRRQVCTHTAHTHTNVQTTRSHIQLLRHSTECVRWPVSSSLDTIGKASPGPMSQRQHWVRATIDPTLGPNVVFGRQRILWSRMKCRQPRIKCSMVHFWKKNVQKRHLIRIGDISSYLSILCHSQKRHLILGVGSTVARINCRPFWL